MAFGRVLDAPHARAVDHLAGLQVLGCHLRDLLLLVDELGLPGIAREPAPGHDRQEVGLRNGLGRDLEPSHGSRIQVATGFPQPHFRKIVGM